MRLKVAASQRPPEIAPVGDGQGWQFEKKALAPTFAHFEVKALASDRPSISIFDYIGDDGNGGGVTVARIAAALRSIGSKPIAVEMNSPGGDYFAGVAIYNLLRRHPAAITVQILGLAASAASVIAMAGDRIEIAENAEIMIHQARGLFAGTADQMRAAVVVLDQIDTAMVETYAARTSLAPAKLSGMMKAETFMTGAEAVKLGFADAVMARAAEPVVYADGRDAMPRDPKSLDRKLAAEGMSRSARRELYRAIKGEPSPADPNPEPNRAASRRALLAAMAN